MYIIDLIRKLFRKSNFPTLIYLILNVLFFGLIVMILFEQPFGSSVLIGLVFYIPSLLIALSPIGEWILRLQTGCRRIQRMDYLNRIQPLFNQVYRRARTIDPRIPNNVQLFMNDSDTPNAFATGRRTICITRGLLNIPDNQIMATLGHEFGHLAHKDTDLILLVTVGNMVFNGLVLFIRGLIWLFYGFFMLFSILLGGREGAFALFITWVCKGLTMIFVNCVLWIWTQLGNLLVMKSSRENEYEADQFCFNLGYGTSLCQLLDNIAGGSPTQGLFATLASSHPNTDLRISRLQRLGANYRGRY